MSNSEEQESLSFYVLNSSVKLREDEYHEFKMHMNMTAEDIAESRKKYKRAISRSVYAASTFLTYTILWYSVVLRCSVVSEDWKTVECV